MSLVHFLIQITKYRTYWKIRVFSWRLHQSIVVLSTFMVCGVGGFDFVHWKKGERPFFFLPFTGMEMNAVFCSFWILLQKFIQSFARSWNLIWILIVYNYESSIHWSVKSNNINSMKLLYFVSLMCSCTRIQETDFQNV